jgi:chromosome segregation ATPase
MEKSKLPKAPSNLSRAGTITPSSDDDVRQTSALELEAPVLSDQDQLDIKRGRENPKLNSMVRHIDTLIEKTKKVRNELSGMIQTSVDLKEQCKFQEQEVALLDQEQQRVSNETNELRNKVEQLANEKVALEKKLEELKLDNDELEAFLAQNKKVPLI